MKDQNMSLYKVKHLTYRANLNRKSIKIEVADSSEFRGKIITYYHMIFFLSKEGVPCWEKWFNVRKLTGKLRICLKTRGRGRPNSFQQYKAPIIERWDEECQS